MDALAEAAPVEANASRRADAFIGTLGASPGSYDGRGIVICGGGRTYFTNAWIAISLLRHVGCRLPVQLWYLGPGELDPYMEQLVAPLDVQCIDAWRVREAHPARILRGWEVKPYSIIHSPFREVLLLDADNFVAKDPAFLFDSREYRATGALFWPDAGRMAAGHRMWDVFGVPYLDEPEFESGQIVIDKVRCWRALLLTKYYNDHSDFYYRHVHGDKETFHFAFRRLGMPYAMTPHPMRLEGGTFFQHDFGGDLLFQHRNRNKWSLDGANPPVAGFRHEDKCRDFLDKLRRSWSGVVGDGARRDDQQAVIDARAALTAQVYRWVRPGAGYHPVSFMNDGQVGIGATDSEKSWAVYLAGNRLQLEIGAEGSASTVLHADGSGWRSPSGDAELELIPGLASAQASETASLSAFASHVVAYAEPLSQNNHGGDLGFGWIYYAMARNLRPDFAIVIGSARGFAPLCVARGLHDNGHGRVIFIDPSYSGSGHPAWDGRGHWSHASEVEKWFGLFGLAPWLHHLKLRSDDALGQVRTLTRGARVGLVLIDGAHTREQSLADFDNYAALLSDGVVLFHDATNPRCGVAATLQTLRTRGLDVTTLDLDVGLSWVRVRRPPRVEDKWSYLTTPSNRGRLLMEHLRPRLRAGDRIFEAYCGFSPLNEHYVDASVFGFDIDPVIIEKLRATYPSYQWAQIEERQLAYAALPERVDVLVGLGLSYGYCGWDAQLVEPNIRFLARHYRPRVCLFETAADYHDGEILGAARRIVEALGYLCHEAVIETDMQSYHRRKLLVAEAT